MITLLVLKEDGEECAEHALIVLENNVVHEVEVFDEMVDLVGIKVGV